MKIYRYAPIGLVIMLAGCFEPAESRAPIESLSFEQLRTIVADCQVTGKITTDDYCRQAGYVYERMDQEQREKDRLARAKKEKYETKSKVLDF